MFFFLFFFRFFDLVYFWSTLLFIFFVLFLLRLYLLFPLYLPLTRRLATRNQKNSLNNQCNGLNIIARGTCRALADVYYAAVRAFGGSDATPGKRNEDLEKEYNEKLAIYNVLLAEAKKGNYI